MTKLEQEQLLKVIETQYSLYETIYWLAPSNGKNGFSFIGYEGIDITFTALASTIRVDFKSALEVKDNASCSVELPFELCKPFVEHVFLQYCKTEEPEEYFGKYYQYVVEEKKKILDELKALQLDDITENTVIQGIHTIKLGKLKPIIINMNSKTSWLTCHTLPVDILIPENLKSPKAKGKQYIETKLYIPGWEIGNYPLLESIIKPDTVMSDFSLLMDKFQKISPQLGNILHNVILEDKLSTKPSGYKKKKI